MHVAMFVVLIPREHETGAYQQPPTWPPIFTALFLTLLCQVESIADPLIHSQGFEKIL
jgi:hypothetical protein